MRIGQRLIRESLITNDQLDEALRIQIGEGGRLGSTLVRLGFLSTDDLARSLGRHYGMPALSSQHIMLASEELHSRLSADLAISWGAIPVSALRGEHSLIAVAVADPLPPEGVKSLSDALRSNIVLAIAPEIDINAQLHRIYGMPSSLRIIRHHFPSAYLPGPEDAEYEMEIQLDEEPDASDEQFDQRSAEMPIDTSIPMDLDDFGDSSVQVMSGDEQVPTSKPPPKPMTTSPSDESAVVQRVESPGSAPLGRIAIKKVVGGQGSGVLEIDGSGVPDSFLAALRSIRLSKKRDQIGSRVLSTMRDFMDYQPDIGIILIARDKQAMGWKAFARSGNSAWVGKLRVPLDAPSVLHKSFLDRDVDTGEPSDSDINQRLWQIMGTERPAFTASAPVILNEANMCLLYIQGSAPASFDAVEVVRDQIGQLAKTMAKSFLQLIRASQR